MLKPWHSFMSFVSKLSVFMLYRLLLNLMLWRACWNACTWGMGGCDAIMQVNCTSWTTVPAMLETTWGWMWVLKPEQLACDLYHKVALSLDASVPLSIKWGLTIAPNLKFLVGNKLVYCMWKGLGQCLIQRKCSINASCFILTTIILMVFQ